MGVWVESTAKHDMVVVAKGNGCGGEISCTSVAEEFGQREEAVGAEIGEDVGTGG